MNDAIPSDGGRILVADDDEDILNLVSFRLKRAGYDVQIARDGAEALENMRASAPDLLVLDVRMPRVDGFGVLREMRSDPAMERVPVILLTASVQDRDVERGFEAGADDYMRKPFNPQELQARVRTVLGRR